MNNPSRHSYEFGRFRLDAKRERLWNDGKRVDLTPNEYKTLLYLIDNRDYTVSTSELLDKVWEDKYVEVSNVYTTIKSLRDKLCLSVKESRYKYIKTEQRKGYCFAADVVVVRGDARDNGESQPTPPVPEEVIAHEVEPDPEPPNGDSQETNTLVEDAEAEDAPTDLVIVETENEGVPAEVSRTETDVLRVESKTPPTANEVSEERRQSRELTFGRWALGPGWKITGALSIGVAVAIVFSVSGLFRNSEQLAALCALHFVLITSAFLFTPRARGSEVFDYADPAIEAEIMEDCGYHGRREEWEEAKEQADEALRQHTRYWKVLLASWSLLYFVLMLKSLPALNAQTQAAQENLRGLVYGLSMMATLFNNCSALALVLCYIILNEITVIRQRGRTVSDVPWLEALVPLSVVTLGELFLLALSISNEGLHSVNTGRIINGGDWVSGVLVSVAMALYIGRLQSKFLGSPLWLPPLLYLYTAIQPLYAFIDLNRWWAVWLICGALALKCLLFLYAIWLSQSARLLFYFLRVRRVYEKVEADWKNFHSIFDEKFRSIERA